MLDRALRAGIVERRHVVRIADRMAAFYADAEPMPMRPAIYRAGIAADVTNDCRWLCHPEFGLDRDLAERPSTVLLGVLRSSGQLIEARADRLVEGHGDLRPGHVAIGDGRPVVIDCLEFRPEFRIVDPVDELAFLGVECERLQAPWIGPALLDRYQEVVGDQLSEPLVNFYAARRAILRAKLAVWHLRDADVRNASKWQHQATEYLELASHHAERADPSHTAGLADEIDH
jgi:aminoglycoside phosphotransferase family enzyme